MAESLWDQVTKLSPDPWRSKVGFSPEMVVAQNELFRQKVTQSERIGALNGWLQKYQPCLFGRIAAKLGTISYCIIDEQDLQISDEHVHDKIQQARTSWTREAFEGRKSAFILFILSPLISSARPDGTVLDLARNVCSLYLLQDIRPNMIYHDEILLEFPGQSRATFRWAAGVNYFSSQGDKRWWHDHRIPGGMAFSVNSVGHMVKSGMLAKAMKEIRELSESFADGPIFSKIDSLPAALDLAMRTIDNAAEIDSAKATWLIPLSAQDSSHANQRCPVELPSALQEMSFCEYRGNYHTDQTIPSEYFREDVGRSCSLPEHTLDFTYLFGDTIANPDFLTMGKGRRVRAGSTIAQSAGTKESVAPHTAHAKRSKATGKAVLIADCPRLKASKLKRSR